MSFDEPTVRAGTHQLKWAAAGSLGLTGGDALPMWIADMDFDAAPVLQQAAIDLARTGILGYFAGTDRCAEAVARWMADRHGWPADPSHMLFAHGLGNGIAVCLQALSEPGDGVVIFAPVYHEFTSKIRKNGRRVHKSPLVRQADGRFGIDFDALEAGLHGDERLMLISSPHNPAGRIWTPDEQRRLAEICARHDIILLCDEVHHDLVFPGERHVPMAVAVPEVADRLVTLTAASKTFNVAGIRVGTLTAPAEPIRNRLRQALGALDIQPNIFGVAITTAAYSPDGAAWVDELTPYLADNARVFADGVGAIPGLRAMPMQSTYLAWVDFAPLGMEPDEVRRRVIEVARIGPSPGPAFGTGGATGMRFNIGTQRARVEEAVARLQDAFADLQ